MSKEIISYNPTKAAIADLTARYKGLVFDVTTSNGMAEAKAAYKEINAHRIALENARKKEKAESLEYGRFVDSEAKRIDEQLEALRLPIKEQIETETKREEREEAAKVEAERLRILAEQEAAKKAEEARMAAERAEIKRKQDELAKAAAEQARIVREAALKIELDQPEARMKIEEEQRQERLARQAREEVERVKRLEEENRLKAEREKIDADRRAVEEAKRKEQAEAEAKAKAIRDAEEAKQREERRKAAEKEDARGMARLFRERYKHLPECEDVIKAIDAYLAWVAIPERVI